MGNSTALSLKSMFDDLSAFGGATAADAFRGFLADYVPLDQGQVESSHPELDHVCRSLTDIGVLRVEFPSNRPDDPFVILTAMTAVYVVVPYGEGKIALHYVGDRTGDIRDTMSHFKVRAFPLEVKGLSGGASTFFRSTAAGDLELCSEAAPSARSRRSPAKKPAAIQSLFESIAGTHTAAFKGLVENVFTDSIVFSPDARWMAFSADTKVRRPTDSQGKIVGCLFDTKTGSLSRIGGVKGLRFSNLSRHLCTDPVSGGSFGLTENRPRVFRLGKELVEIDVRSSFSPKEVPDRFAVHDFNNGLPSLIIADQSPMGAGGFFSKAIARLPDDQHLLLKVKSPRRT